MDGALFDHDEALRRDLLAISSPEEIKHFNLHECNLRGLENFQYMKNRINLVHMRPGWWRNLSIYQPGWDIYDVAREIGFCCKILTKGPSSKPQAWTEKVECVYQWFGQDMPIDIVGSHKRGTYGRVLVDDYPDYMVKWLEHRPRGLGIMPVHDYNKDFNHPNVVKYDGDNIDEVRRAMQAAFNRDREQHWSDIN